MAERREVLLDIQVRDRDAQKRLGEVNASLKQNSESLKELNRQYRTGEISVETYGDATAAVKLESAELRKEQRSLTRQITNTTKATKAAEGSNEQLRAQLSLLTAEYNGLSKEQRENTERGKELQIQTRAISDELKENESAVGDNRRNVGNYQSALDGLGGALDKVIPGFSNFTKGLGSAAGKGKEAGGALSSLAGKGGKLGKVAGSLSKKIGGPLVTALIALVTAGVQAAQAIAAVTREFDPLLVKVEQITGATGDIASSLTGTVQGIADTFGQDFNEVLTAANTTANAFGISIEEALRQIGEGFINGADASGQYLDVLKEYPTQLASVGLSLEEANALILTQTQEGIFSDKGIDAIKEAGIRLRELPKATRDALEGIGLVSDEIETSLREGSVSLFDVIQQVGGRLGELEANSPEVGAALADIFGGPGEDAGLEFIKILGETAESLDEVSRVSEETRERLRQQLKASDDLADAKARLASDFAPVVSLFDRFGKQVLTAVIRALNGFVDFITQEIPAAFNALRLGIAAIPEFVQGVIDNILANLEIAALEVKNFFDFSGETEEQLRQLRANKKDFAELGQELGASFSGGYYQEIEKRRAEARGREAIRQAEAAAAEAKAAREAAKRAQEERARLSEAAVRERERKAQEELRAEQQRQRELLESQKAAIEQRINEEKLGLLRLEQDTLISDDRRNELRLEREKKLINLRAQLALVGLEEESAEARLIVAQSEAEIAQIQIDESNRVLGIKLENAQAEREAIAQNAAAQAAAADARAKQTEEQAERERAAIEANLLLEQQANQNKIALAGETFAVAADLLGEQTALGKVAAIASATISTYQAAATALANPPGPPFTIPLAALAVAAGLRQVSEIASVNTSFAEGGFTGAGFMADRNSPGNRIAGIVHDGEYVAPRRVVANPIARPAINFLEGMRQRGSFANGGFAGVQAASRQTESAMNVGQDLVNAVMSMPPQQVSVTDINKVQNRVQVKQRTGL